MPKVAGPLHSLEAKGRFGDSALFSSWLGRSYVKIWRPRSSRASRREEQTRSGFGTLSKEWANLTPEDRKAWEVFANKLRPRNIPHCMFLSYAILARDAGLPLPVRPPKSKAPIRPVIQAIREQEGRLLVVSWTLPEKPPLPEGTLLDLWLQMTRPSRRAYDKHYHHALYVPASEKVAVIEISQPNFNCYLRARYILPDSARSLFSEASC